MRENSFRTVERHFSGGVRPFLPCHRLFSAQHLAILHRLCGAFGEGCAGVPDIFLQTVSLPVRKGMTVLTDVMIVSQSLP